MYDGVSSKIGIGDQSLSWGCPYLYHLKEECRKEFQIEPEGSFMKYGEIEKIQIDSGITAKVKLHVSLSLHHLTSTAGISQIHPKKGPNIPGKKDRQQIKKNLYAGAPLPSLLSILCSLSSNNLHFPSNSLILSNNAFLSPSHVTALTSTSNRAVSFST